MIIVDDNDNVNEPARMRQIDDSEQSPDLLAPYVKKLAEGLEPPKSSWPHRLIVGSRRLENGNVLIGAHYEPIPADEVNLGCDGC